MVFGARVRQEFIGFGVRSPTGERLVRPSLGQNREDCTPPAFFKFSVSLIAV